MESSQESFTESFNPGVETLTPVFSLLIAIVYFETTLTVAPWEPNNLLGTHMNSLPSFYQRFIAHQFHHQESSQTPHPLCPTEKPTWKAFLPLKMMYFCMVRVEIRMERGKVLSIFNPFLVHLGRWFPFRHPLQPKTSCVTPLKWDITLNNKAPLLMGGNI